MKTILAFACLLALAYANDDVKVLRHEVEVNPDSFEYAFELDNGIKAHQNGKFEKKDVWTVKGDFEYKEPKGEHIELSYVADELGYHPDPNSPLLPTPHPIPEHILRSIKYIETHIKEIK